MTDGGGEFLNSRLKQALDDIGAELIVSSPTAHQQNGLAERNNQTIQKLARTMLIAANLHHSLWAEAVSTAVHILNIINICPSTGKSAFETIYKVPPNTVDSA